MTNSQQKPASKTLAIPAEAGERLVLGEISPAEFLGIPRERLYEIATRGHELLVTGKLKEALEIFKGLVAASPHDSVFHCNLAAVYVQLEQIPEAMEEYTRAIELNIGNVDALVGRSELFLRDNRVVEALQDIKSVLKYDPEGKRENTKRARITLASLQSAAEAASKS
ncbi:tetratricopeptide repeat protein [Cystobacter fuscus]|uniref:tetratricopeptide repeat protein n=1 Tax=Cystobacter fuscus TaxID=43 RepID=UPI002B32197B|nr:tetratricopeptide repeat protein [Cystobacter fuscus]